VTSPLTAPSRSPQNVLSLEPSVLCRVAGGPHVPEGTAQWLHTRAGRRVRTARFEPSGIARGSVVLSPGRTEPIEKYGDVAADLLSRGFVVLLHDWAGQGLSQRFQADPLRGDVVGSWRLLVQDYTDVLNVHAATLPQPWIAMGHSMGAGLTALALCEGESRFAGAALCAPLIAFSVGALPLWVARLVVNAALQMGCGPELVRPQIDPLRFPFEDNVCTHDRTRYDRLQTLYRAYPELCLGEPTWRWLRFALDLLDRLSLAGGAERIVCPVAIVAAGDDRVVDNRAIRRFAARVPTCSYSEVPSAFHEILVETEERRRQFWQVFDRLAAEVAPANAPAAASSTGPGSAASGFSAHLAGEFG
jgi:lysophospholipase